MMWPLGAVRVPPVRVAWVVLVVVVVIYGVFGFSGALFVLDDPVDVVLCGLCVLLLVVVQLGWLSRPGWAGPGWMTGVALLVQAVVVFVPIAVVGPVWHGLPGVLAGSALFVLPRRFGVPAFVAVVGAVAAISGVAASVTRSVGSFVAVGYTINSAVCAGLVVFGLSSLLRLVVEAERARVEFRRAAVEAERVRLAREVHDALGQTLSQIALRGELVARLVGGPVDAARAELQQVLAATREALAEVRRVVGIRDELNTHPDSANTVPVPAFAVRLTRVILVLALGALGTTAVVALTIEQGPQAGLVLALCRVGLIAGLLVAVRWDRRVPLWRRLLLLAVLSVLAYGPQPLLGPISHSPEHVLGGAMLLLLPALAAVPLVLLASVGAAVIEAIDPSPTTSLAVSMSYQVLGTILVSTFVFGLGTLSRLVAQVHAARTEVGRVAVAQERVRVARDVHDLLGLGLSTIALRCELADRLLERDPARASAEVAGVLEATQSALVEVRSVIGGNRTLSLAQEFRSVVAVLEAAAVRVRAVRPDGVPEGVVGTVLATILREAGTNVLRHSSASWCEISLRCVGGSAELVIANDGLGEDTGGSSAGGNGLRNMGERVTAVGGALRTGREGAVFRVSVSVPLRGGARSLVAV